MVLQIFLVVEIRLKGEIRLKETKIIGDELKVLRPSDKDTIIVKVGNKFYKYKIVYDKTKGKHRFIEAIVSEDEAIAELL